MRSEAAGVLFLLLASAAAAPAQEAVLGLQLIERVVAVVDERPLLLSDVRALGLVRDLAPDAALEAAIDERLMHDEAARVAQAEVSAEQVDAALEKLVAGKPALRATVPEADLRRLLRRQLAIVLYVDFRFRSQILVSDEEVRRTWEREPGGPALEDAFTALRERLARRALDERIEEWVEELRSRADLRYVGGPLPRSF